MSTGSPGQHSPQCCLQAEEQDPDLFFRDQPRPAAPEGNINREYISLFSDEVPSLTGRTPLGCYSDYMVCSWHLGLSIMTSYHAKECSHNAWSLRGVPRARNRLCP